MNASTDGIILLSKQSGITSFSSLWQIKNALGTKKIGHTGTLDTFAEGLLVVLAGRLTRLVSYITDCDKEYEALVSFGTETDTLDPDGEVIEQSPLPNLADLTKNLASFRGDIMQRPPSYSAVHVNGQRASDRIRKGESIDLPFRPVTVYSLEILEVFTADGSPATDTSHVSAVILNIVCSKGTYVRSLARDIARSSQSCAHLASLRRKRIGPFRLEDAAGFSMLAPFGTVPPAKYGKGDKPLTAEADDIRNNRKSFTAALAPSIGLSPLFLLSERLNDFLNGKTPLVSWFTSPVTVPGPSVKYAVFCGDFFAGVVTNTYGIIAYDFVSGHEL